MVNTGLWAVYSIQNQFNQVQWSAKSAGPETQRRSGGCWLQRGEGNARCAVAGNRRTWMASVSACRVCSLLETGALDGAVSQQQGFCRQSTAVAVDLGRQHAALGLAWCFDWQQERRNSTGRVQQQGAAPAELARRASTESATTICRVRIMTPSLSECQITRARLV